MVTWEQHIAMLRHSFQLIRSSAILLNWPSRVAAHESTELAGGPESMSKHWNVRLPCDHILCYDITTQCPSRKQNRNRLQKSYYSKLLTALRGLSFLLELSQKKKKKNSSKNHASTSLIGTLQKMSYLKCIGCFEYACIVWGSVVNAKEKWKRDSPGTQFCW